MLHKTTRTLLPLTRNTLDPTTIIRSIFSSIFISEFYLFLSFFLFLLHFSPPLFYNNSTLKYRESRRATRNNRRVSRTLCRLIERDKRSKMASNQTSTEYGSCVSRVGWREREEEGDRERKRERGVASEGNGVSFRGIDVSQYTPDAVDTPICNPRPQSLPSRNCVLKVRQGESYSSPSAALTVFLPPPPDLPRVISLFNPFSPPLPEKISSSTALIIPPRMSVRASINRGGGEIRKRRRRRRKRGENDEGAASSPEEFYRSTTPPSSPRVLLAPRVQCAIGQRKRSMNSARKIYYRAAIIGNTRQDKRDNIGV